MRCSRTWRSTTGSSRSTTRSSSPSPTTSCRCSPFALAAVAAGVHRCPRQHLAPTSGGTRAGGVRCPSRRPRSTRAAPAFLSAMTHNLRTPLASIKASVSTLRRPDRRPRSPTTRTRLLVTAHEETERLERLVTKVLELSRIHAGAVEPRREPTDVGRVHAWRGATAAPPRRAATGYGSPKAGDVAIVAVDPEMIELVLVVLLENALRFAPHRYRGCRGRRRPRRRQLRGPSRRSRARRPRAAARQDLRRVRRASTGPRTAPVRGSVSPSPRALVDAHDGLIEVETTPGGGATFVVTLPDEGPSA